MSVHRSTCMSINMYEHMSDHMSEHTSIHVSAYTSNHVVLYHTRGATRSLLPPRCSTSLVPLPACRPSHGLSPPRHIEKAPPRHPGPQIKIGAGSSQSTRRGPMRRRCYVGADVAAEPSAFAVGMLRDIDQERAPAMPFSSMSQLSHRAVSSILRSTKKLTCV